MRAAVLADVDRLVELEQSCMGADAWSRALISDGVAGGLPTISWLVSEHGYAVASYVGDVVELQRIGVDPRARRTGEATGLLAAVVQRRTTEDRVVLEVREDNAGALAFYSTAGFVELGRRARYYRDGTAAVVLEMMCP